MPKRFSVFLTLALMGLSSLASAQLVTDGLVAYWPLDSGTIAGDTVKDMWGENHGTIQGDPKIAAGVVRDALEFDGDDSVDIVGTDALNFSGKNEMTVAAWVNAGSDDPVQGVVAGCCGTIVAQRDANGWALRYDGRNGGMEMEFIVHTANAWVGDGGFGAPRFTPGEWHHLAGVVAKDKLQLYLDGDLIQETNLGGDIASGGPETEIGHATDGGFIGLIDEVVIYDRALSEAEIKQIYDARGLAVEPNDKLAVTWAVVKDARR